MKEAGEEGEQIPAASVPQHPAVLHPLSIGRHYLIERVSVVAGYLGKLLVVFGAVLMLPALPGLVYHEYHETSTFLAWGLVTAGLGLLLRRLLPRGRMGMREAVLFCTSAWVICSIFSALPLHFATGMGYLNSLFETVSGLTTTGATVIRNLDTQSHAVIFWRSISQLLGGLGILSFFLLVSYPGSAAHRLFQSEATKAGVPRPAPSLRHTVIITWAIYGLLLLFNIIVLTALGTGWFNSLNYAFTTTSTGGFSPHALGLGYFRAIGHPYAFAIELTTAFFMALGGVNFLLHYQALSGNVWVVFSGVEARRYWLLMAVGVLLIAIESLGLPDVWHAFGQFHGPTRITGAVACDAFRYASFQVVSVTSTGGHQTLPLESSFFGPAAHQLFLFLLVIGGCAGSTAGGLKVLRGTVLGRSLRQEIRRLSHPDGATLPVVLDGHLIDVRTLQPIATMAYAWIITGLLGGVLLALNSGRGAIECLSLSISALSNVGPSLMPTAVLPTLPAFSKWLLIVWMIAGRLEILPVLVLFSSRTWRR